MMGPGPGPGSGMGRHDMGPGPGPVQMQMGPRMGPGGMDHLGMHPSMMGPGGFWAWDGGHGPYGWYWHDALTWDKCCHFQTPTRGLECRRRKERCGEQVTWVPLAVVGGKSCGFAGNVSALASLPDETPHC